MLTTIHAVAPFPTRQDPSNLISSFAINSWMTTQLEAGTSQVAIPTPTLSATIFHELPRCLYLMFHLTFARYSGARQANHRADGLNRADYVGQGTEGNNIRRNAVPTDGCYYVFRKAR